jgi:beta-fructofuranosidase
VDGVLRLTDHWVWDSWPVDDEAGRHHLFFLQAPRALGDPDARHLAATVGHAVSTDHHTWQVLPDALRPAHTPAWDDLAIWTGSVIRGPRSWHLFYTGLSRREGETAQRIGRADSDDLIHWRRAGAGPVTEPDPRWYAPDAWRDPWVFADPGGDGWHMLITARVAHHGVIGHAWSADLTHWQVLEPLNHKAARFHHLEVPQVSLIDGRAVLTFSCQDPAGGMWSAPAASLLGPYAIDQAEQVGDPSLYAAHVITLNDGRPALLGFADNPFRGEIPDPRPVRLTPNGVLTITTA